MIAEKRIKTARIPGREAQEKFGVIKAYRFLLIRRVLQILVIILFSFPIMDFWILQGSLASSLLVHSVPLSDPFIFLQSLTAGNLYAISGFLGALIIAGTYFFLGGRTYCSFVCPINIVTDAAHWLRQKYKFQNHLSLSRNTRIFVLGLVLGVSLISQSIVWELVNPITGLFRALVYGSFSLTNMGLMLSAVIFILDAMVGNRLWCGHLCPVGSFYGLIGKKTPLRIKAQKLSSCDDCMDCFKICPEPHVLRPVLKEKYIYVNDSDCTRCGRCIDVCHVDVFKYEWKVKPDVNAKLINR